MTRTTEELLEDAEEIEGVSMREGIKADSERLIQITDRLIQIIKQLITDKLKEREWHPISTAPKDGTNILVWWPSECHCPLVAHWNDGKWNNNKIGWKFTGWDNSKETEPTHWMPLHTPPKKEDE